MKNLVFVSAMLGVCLLVCAGSPALAAVILPYDSGGFETDTLGAVATDNPAGWGIPTIPAPGDISIVTGSSTGGSGANAQVLDYDFTATSYWETPLNLDAEEEDSLLNLEYKVMVKADTGALRVNLRGYDTSWSSTSYIQLDARAGKMRFKYFSDGHGSNYGFSNLLENVVAGDWYQVTQTLDLASETFDVTITDLDNPAQTGTWTNLGFATALGATNKMDKFIIERASNIVGDSFQIDDVKLNVVVPEPASLGLLALMGLMFAGKRPARR